MEVKIGLVQMKMSEVREQNLKKALAGVRDAARMGAQVVCLPELFETMYFPQLEDAKVSAETVPNKTTEILSETAKENGIVLVAGSIFERDEGLSYNTSIVFDESGRELGKYRKVHIPQDPSFYEQDYFSSGKGYLVCPTRFGKVAVLICFDQWYPEAARICRLLGADMIFYPTAIGTVEGVEQTEGSWREAWETVQRGHAIANSVVVAAVNRVGVEGEMQFWGGSFVSDQFGKFLVRGDSNERVLVTNCQTELGEEIERGWGFARNRHPETYERIARK